MTKYGSSQAVQVDRTLYLSGVLGLDKNTNKLVTGGTVAEARQALDNLGKILNASDSSYENDENREFPIHIINTSTEEMYMKKNVSVGRGELVNIVDVDLYRPTQHISDNGSKLVKTTILLNDIADFGSVNEVYKEYEEGTASLREEAFADFRDGYPVIYRVYKRTRTARVLQDSSRYTKTSE
uniref:Uncharacterized protein n=1 Tax=Timema shepardi TaxID=629360 RepID=A0A7R9AY01_TIMSH|nr:unnamed protein product [Timema shepardi]